MRELAGTIFIAVLTLAGAAGSVLAIRQLRARGAAAVRLARGIAAASWLCALGSGAALGYRFVFVHRAWAPLEAHVDGLLLIAALVALSSLYLQARSRLPGAPAFALPLTSLLLAWAICASAWTFHPFTIDSVWKALHLVGVYLGSLSIAIAAVAGAMYLLADFWLRRKRDPANLGRLGSLEAIERLMIRTSALGFALISLGLASGLLIVASGPTRLGPGWWYSPKIVLAAAVWIIYALVMNVRHATRFRGSRAAVLSIAGLVLLLITLALATRGDDDAAASLPTGPTVSEGREMI